MSSSDCGVLIVDDEVLIADFAEMVVVDEGLQVIGVAGSIGEALVLAAANPPRLAMLDVNLADGEDGVDLAAKLQSRYGTRIIFSSGSENPAARAAALGVQTSGFLQKPFVAAELVQLLRGLQRAASVV